MVTYPPSLPKTWGDFSWLGTVITWWGFEGKIYENVGALLRLWFWGVSYSKASTYPASSNSSKLPYKCFQKFTGLVASSPGKMTSTVSLYLPVSPESGGQLALRPQFSDESEKSWFLVHSPFFLYIWEWQIHALCMLELKWKSDEDVNHKHLCNILFGKPKRFCVFCWIIALVLLKNFKLLF